MFPIKNDWLHMTEIEFSLPFLGNRGKKHHLFYSCWRKMESTQHVWCLKRERGGKLVWRNNPGPVCCLGMTVSPLAPPPPHSAQAGFSSACSNDVDDFVMPVSLWTGCRTVQGQGLLWTTKKSFLFWLSGLRVWWVDFLFTLLFVLFFVCCFLNHCVLQLLVYMRIVEFVCTLINSQLKCFWTDNLLVSLQKLLQQRSFLGWRKFIRHPPPPGWHKSLPPSARPERSFFD